MSDMSMDEMIEVLARYRYNAKHDADRIKSLEDELGRLRGDVDRLRDRYGESTQELSRLRASSFVTAVPAEQYERLKRAAELVIKQSCRYHPPIIAMQILKDWDEAKGGQS
jgi:predicted nuclease with TOPRIM domain